MKVDWKQALIIAGGAAATGVALFYLLRPEGKKEKNIDSVKSPAISKTEILKLLEDINASQEKIKSLMKELTRLILDQNLSFEETCKLVAQRSPVDPLEMHGITMAEFDTLIEQHQHDPEIKSAVLRIMGSIVPSRAPISRSHDDVSVEELVAIHEYMRDELSNVAQQDIHPKVLTLAAQAYVGASVKNKFTYGSEDVENSVMYHHQELATNEDFAQINMAIQAIMASIVEPERF